VAVLPGGWVQVTRDPGRAGPGLLNLAVDDLPAARDELAGRGLERGEIEPMNKGVELSPLSDPDENTVTLIGNFRVNY
jgi:glyoxylase I family protein